MRVFEFGPPEEAWYWAILPEYPCPPARRSRGHNACCDRKHKTPEAAADCGADQLRTWATEEWRNVRHIDGEVSGA